MPAGKSDFHSMNVPIAVIIAEPFRSGGDFLWCPAKGGEKESSKLRTEI
jgi:hypothetical protein